MTSFLGENQAFNQHSPDEPRFRNFRRTMANGKPKQSAPEMGRYTSQKMKILLLLLVLATSFLLFVLTAAVLDAAPYGTNIPLPTNFGGQSSEHNHQYRATYDSYFGGHWDVRGRRQNNTDGSYTDTIRGTVSDMALSGTFTKTASFLWLSDSTRDAGGGWISCDSLTITISGGNVSGRATFRIP